MYYVVIDYLNKNEISFSCRFGFRKCHPTYLTSMVLMNKLIKFLNNGDCVFCCCFFLEFLKGFWDHWSWYFVTKSRVFLYLRHCFIMISKLFQMHDVHQMELLFLAWNWSNMVTTRVYAWSVFYQYQWFIKVCSCTYNFRILIKSCNGDMDADSAV